MKHDKKTKKQLIEDLEALRSEIDILRKTEPQPSHIEEDLREIQEHFGFITDHMLDAMVIIDWEGNVLYANKATFSLVGLEMMHDLTSLNIFQFISPEDHQTTRENLLKTRKSKEPFLSLYKIITRDGQERWIEGLGKKIIFQNREADLVTIRDVTERKLFEEQILLSEKKFAVAFLSSPAPMVITSPENGEIIDVNQSFDRWSGYSRDELIGHTTLELGFWLDVEDRHHMVEELGAKGTVDALEIRFRIKGGGIRDVLYSARFIELDDKPYILSYCNDITERRRAEEALKERQARVDSIFRAAPTGIGVVSNRILLEVNDRICDMTGYSREELVGNSARMLYPTQEEFDFVGSEKYRQIQAMGTGSVETRWLRKDGSIIDIILSSTPIIVGDLSAGVTFTALDITERKKMEGVIRESEERFRLAFENASTGMCLVDMEGRLKKVNNQMCEIFGYNRDELESMTVNNIAHPGDVDTSTAFIQRALSGEITGGTFEKRYIHKQGHVVYGLVCSSLVRDYQGSPLYFISQVQDITESKQAEKVLKESEERYRRITSAVTDYIFTVHVEGGHAVRTIHSPACEAVTGYTVEEFNRDPYLWFNMVLEEDRGKVRDHVSKILAGNNIGAIEHRIRRKDGTVRWVINTPVLHLDSSGVLISYDGVLTDITARKLAEVALREGEQKLQMILHDFPISTFVLDKNHHVTHWNEALEQLSKIRAKDIIGTKEQWRAFYSNERPCMADLIIDQETKAIPEWYSGKHEKSQLIDEAYEATDFFPSLGEAGKWLRFTAAPIRNSAGELVGAIETLEDITERKMAENALKESETRFRDLTENTSDWIWEVDDQMRYVYASPRIKELLGYEQADVLGKMPTDFMTPEDAVRIRHNIEDLIKAPRPFRDLENVNLHKDGSLRVLETSGVPIYDSKGRFSGFRGIDRDITRRKKTEEALRESEERYRGIASNLPGVVYQFYARRNGEMGLYYVNERSQKILGLESSLKDFFPQFTACVAPEDREHFLTSIQEAVRTVSNWEFEGRYIKPTGEEMHVRGISQPKQLDNEIVFNGVMLDVTDRKKAEKALKESEERFRSLIQSSSDVIVIMDEKGLITYETPSVERILGYKPGDLIGKFPVDHIHPDDLDKVMSALDEVYQANNPGTPTEFRFCRADGTWIYLEAIGKNLLDFPGINGVVITARDITDRKKSEEERIEMERRLLHAQKLESLGVMAGGIAHDFNNLLMAILGNLDLALLDLSPVSRPRPFIDQALKAARRAADLTNQMLAYSGKGRFDLKVFDMSELVEEMARLLKASISKTVTLNLQMARDLQPIIADPGQIQQIVMNLIVNASEAIGDQTGIVTITTGMQECDEKYLMQSRLKEKPPPGMYVFFEVKDTGCGMDGQTQERLFDPFFTTKFTGRGLGMAAALGIVSGHRGAIVVESEPRRGTTIRVLFPASDKVMKPLRERKRDAATGNSGADLPHSPAGAVLVVDDEEMVRNLCKSMVERFGYPVMTASDGEEAVALFREHADEIACVILDLTMPNKDGMATFEELQRIRGDIKVIISSGFDEQEVTQRFVGKELAGIIKKPYQLENIRSELIRVLEG